MNNGLDLDIEHYTAGELLNLLRINTPITEDGINSKLKHIFNLYLK